MSNKNSQLALALKVEVQRDVDGLEMGVLEDGRSFLSARSLATLCGVDHTNITRKAQSWASGERKSKFAKQLVETEVQSGAPLDSLFIPVSVGGVVTHAYSDEICMEFLTYYAVLSDHANDTARNNLAKLAKAGLRFFIYAALGYSPPPALGPWRQFHDRLQINSQPDGYFSVFGELALMVLTAIQGGLIVDSHTVPDVSVGLMWARHWNDNNLESRFGPRTQYKHYYPKYFPQAAANGRIDASAYPEDALGVFRRWLRDIYLPQQFPRYLATKTKQNALTKGQAQKILTTLTSNTALPSAPGSKPLFPPKP